MHPLAIAAVLLAAVTHATWNLAAKRAGGSLIVSGVIALAATG